MKKIILLFVFCLLLNCGYEPIYSKKKLEKNYNFTINNIGFSGENNINQNIKNNLINYIGLEDRPIKYDLIINSTIKKSITSKNKKGDPEIFSLKINIDLDVIENNQIKNKISFSESFEYNNKPSKYELKKYEKNIKKNLSYKLSEKILQHLYSSK